MSGISKTGNFSVAAREVDFVTKFNANFKKLRDLLGITEMIRKTPGTKLVSYVAEMKDASLA